LLCKSADGKANSFIYNETTQILTPIGNDLLFVSLISNSEPRYLQVKSILFCLDNLLRMQFDTSFREQLLNINSDTLILQWLSSVYHANEK